MSDVTRLLDAAAAGDRRAAADLLPLVYDELRQLAAARMAAESPGQTLQPTALVHEAYLRLVGDQRFGGRGHFFAAAAEAMRLILVNHARDRKRLKRGGGRVRLELLDQADSLQNRNPAATPGPGSPVMRDGQLVRSSGSRPRSHNARGIGVR